MFKNVKLMTALPSLIEEGKSIADAFLMCKEYGIEPGRDIVIRVYALMRKIERIDGQDINLDKYPSLKADYTKWKQSLTRK